MSALYIPQFRIPNQKPLLGELPDLAHPMSDGLALEYLINEGGGKKIFDGSGNNNTGVFVGDTHFGFGERGSELIFDGTGDYVSTSYIPDPVLPITVIAVFKVNDLTAGRSIVVLERIEFD